MPGEEIGSKWLAAAAPQTMGPRSRDDERRVRLRQNRMYATGLLAAMGATYFGTYAVPDPSFPVLLIRAGAEGGAVGGLADWFAITALFRRPLGLPIPHTAIVPRSKERIGNAVALFIEENFLTREVVLRRLRDAQLGHRIVDWLATPERAPQIAASITRSLPQLLRALDNPELHDFVRRALGEQMERVDIAPVLGRLLNALTTSGEADRLFDTATDAALSWLEQHREDIYRIVGERSRWWIPKAIDKRIAQAIVDGVSELLSHLHQPDSDVRRQFRNAITQLVDELLHSPERRTQVDAAKRRLLSHPDVQNWIGSLWRNALAAALHDLEQPSPKTQATIENLLHATARAIQADPRALAQIEAGIERIALTLVVRRAEIGAVVADVVRGWDERSMSERLELTIGSDLQYIRMSGTLVGASVGALLFAAVHLLGIAD